MIVILEILAILGLQKEALQTERSGEPQRSRREQDYGRPRSRTTEVLGTAEVLGTKEVPRST